MEISDLFAATDSFNTGAEFVMNNPFDEPTDLVFVIAGPYSAPFRAAKNWLQDETHKLARQGGRLTGRGFTPEYVKAEDQEELYTKFLARLVLGWRGMAEGGADIIRTEDSALRILTAAPWLRAQVEKIVADKASFRKGKATAAKIE